MAGRLEENNAARMPRTAYSILLGQPSQGEMFDWMRDCRVLELGITRSQLQQKTTVLRDLSVKAQFRGLGIGRKALAIVTTMADATDSLVFLRAWPKELDKQ